MRGFVIFLLISLLAGTLWIYQQKDTLPVLLVNRFLGSYGIEVISMSGAMLSFRSIHADTIELRIPQSPEIQRVEKFQLQFEARRLLDGNFTSISAQQALLSLPVAGSENGLSTRVADISLLCDSVQRCSGNAHLDIDVDAIHRPQAGINVSASRLSSAIDISYASPELTISVPGEQRFLLDALSYGNQHAEQLELVLGTGSLLQVNLAEQTMLLDVVKSNLAFRIRGAGDAGFRISNIRLSCSALEFCDATAHVGVQIGTTEHPQSGLTMSGLVYDSDIHLQYQATDMEKAIEINLPAGLRFALASANYSHYRVEQMEAITTESWQFRIDLTSRLATALAGNLEVQLPVIRTLVDTEDASLSGLTAKLQQLDARIDFSGTPDLSFMDRLSGSAGLQVSHVYTTLTPYNLWPYLWDSHFQLSDADPLQVQLRVLHPDQTLLSVAARHSIASNSGDATFTFGELDLSPSGSRLSSFIAPLPFEADLLDGTINMEGNVSWRSNATADAWISSGQVRLLLDNLAGFADEFVFAGLTATSAWDLREDQSVATQTPFLLSIRELDPGIPLFNLQSSVGVDTANHLIHLLSPQVEVFGGTASTDSVVIELPDENTPAVPGDVFIVDINAIDVAQMLSLSAYRQVGATGIISGSLPVRLKGLTPLIEGGQLSASAQGGSIRYDQGQSASGNQNLDLVYQALEHYQYDSLSAGVDFDELGELSLSLQMQGQSPNVGQGQRINLNLNISDNIPALLQSLQAADNIAERLQDLLEQR